MNKKIKLYTIDLDGTLLDVKKDGKHTISKENIEAIKKARTKGINIVISTGRIGKSLEDYAELIDADFLVTGNGSEIFNKKEKRIYCELLSVQNVLKVLEITQKYNLALKPDNLYHAYGVTNFIKRFLPKRLGWKISKGYSFPLFEERKKLVLFGSLRKSKMNKAIDEISKIKGVIALSSFNGLTIEVTSEKATKGLAAEFIAKELKLNKNQIAHIGDSMNDSTTIGKVGQLIVMKNGAKELKKLATHIGPRHKNAGVAKVLNGNYKKVVTK